MRLISNKTVFTWSELTSKLGYSLLSLLSAAANAELRMRSKPVLFSQSVVHCKILLNKLLIKY